jgi:diaminohydroxyphosphoribosylaminopyrimidine deaminase/5-amino-6-(5-phosphoribosylamino)uracil reductase
LYTDGQSKNLYSGGPVTHMNDEEMMRRALELAHSVEGRTSPRPSVGAVVARAGIVLGKGATSPPYGPHAEVHALREAGEAARGADLYVTLEPCCVTIHTPPCTTAIIEAGIRRVVIAAHDPNPQVWTRGLSILREAGIEVVTGLGEAEAARIVRPFGTYITLGRPHVTAKWAMTLDGKLATRTGDSNWISNPDSRLWVHNLRDRVDAILVGAGTARVDDPRLTVRLSQEQREHQRPSREGPLRVVLTASGQLPSSLALLQPELAAGTCLIVGEDCPTSQLQFLQDQGLAVVPVALDDSGQVDLLAALQALAARGIMHVLLEGGAQLLGNAFDRQVIDSVAVFVAPKIVGGDDAPSPLGGQGLAMMRDAQDLQDVRVRYFGADVLIEGEL